jgi:uncharacterized membrane protein SirB2
MSPQFYTWLHIVGIMFLFSSLGAQALYIAQGGTKATWQYRRPVAILHGVGMALLLVAGFGLMAKFKYSFETQPWLILKLVIWGILGGFQTIMWKFGRQNLLMYFLLIILGSLAVYSVVFRIGT